METAPTLRERLSRVSSSGRFIPEIDGLRFIAISGVLFLHLAEFMVSKSAAPPRDYLYMIASQGFFGVPLFFVISGFILSLPFAEGHLGLKPRPSLGSYFKRRVIRLEPPYLINLLLLLGLLLCVRERLPEGWLSSFLASAVYLNGLIFRDHSLINVVTWSLEVEVQFYILAPLFAQLFAVRRTALRRALLVGLIALSAGLNEWVRYRTPTLVAFSLLGYLHYFLLGFLLTDWYVLRAPGPSDRSLAWDVLGLCCWAALGLGLIKVATPRFLLLPLILVAYIAAFRGRWSGIVLRHPALTIVGGMCYTIYLYHRAVLMTVGEGTWALNRPAWPWWLNFLCQLVLVGVPVLLISTLLYIGVERPFMRLASARRR